MRTWLEVQEFIDRHALPYRVERYDAHGWLVQTGVRPQENSTVAVTISGAAQVLRRYKAASAKRNIR